MSWDGRTGKGYEGILWTAHSIPPWDGWHRLSTWQALELSRRQKKAWRHSSEGWFRLSKPLDVPVKDCLGLIEVRASAPLVNGTIPWNSLLPASFPMTQCEQLSQAPAILGLWGKKIMFFFFKLSSKGIFYDSNRRITNTLCKPESILKSLLL